MCIRDRIVGTEVWMVMLGGAAEAIGYPLAERLREAGIQVVCNCGGGDIGKQLRRANQNRALFAVIIGEDELENRKFTVIILNYVEIRGEFC